jgi:hypothetical protein
VTASRGSTPGVTGDLVSAGHEAASSHWLVVLARGGLVARGVNYVLIGILAGQIAFGTAGRNERRVGALRGVASHPGGTVVLWLLALGFAGMMLWRLAEAGYGQAGSEGNKPRKRLASLGSAIVYGLVLAGVIGFLLGSGSQTSGNHQSKALTARFMSHAGGRWVVLLVGLVVVGAGLAIIVGGVRRTFLKQLSLGQLSARARQSVEALGVVGVVARGIVFAVVGGFLAIAAVTFDAQKAQGLDGAVHKVATTPLGPWLLVAVALGLVTFGVYSICEARWRDVRPG